MSIEVNQITTTTRYKKLPGLKSLALMVVIEEIE